MTGPDEPSPLPSIPGLRGMVAGMRRAEAIVWTAAPGVVLGVAAISLGQAALPIFSLIAWRVVIDAIAPMGTASLDLQRAFGGALAAGLLALGAASLDSWSIYINEKLAVRVAAHVQDLIHRHSLRLDLNYFETAEYHDRLYRAQQDGGHRPARVAFELANLLRAGASSLGLAGLVIGQGAWLLAVALVAAAWGLIGRVRHSKQWFTLNRTFATKERLLALYDGMITHPTFAKEVRLFGLGARLSSAHRELRAWIQTERLAIAATRARSQGSSQAVAGGATGVVLAGLAYSVFLGRLTPGGLVMNAQAFSRFVAHGKQVLATLAALYEESLFLASLRDFLALEPKVTEPMQPRSPARREGSVRIVDVEFRYPGSEHPVLSGLNLEIGPGEVVALVGENGAGKSTLAKLLCRLYDPDKGRIYLDDVDLRDYGLEELRRSITAIFQDHVHFPLTARENIEFGDLERAGDEAAVREAAEWAAIGSVLTGLPRGYDTPLNKWTEGGRELSIGEWQRLALARARFRRAPLLVMDEPTSALDPMAEQGLVERMASLAGNQTTFFISHRFSSVRWAHRIAVLSAGRIQEEGSHAELLARNSLYARMFNAQAKAYVATAREE